MIGPFLITYVDLLSLALILESFPVYSLRCFGTRTGFNVGVPLKIFNPPFYDRQYLGHAATSDTY
jgi:hypothetical protein